MSHSKERAEKTCLNCGASLYGRYCHQCGQENIEPRQSTSNLITHFFYDITHFDGKFFITLKDLLLRPGFLSLEFMKGRRQGYLDPIRMYLFTSAIFFILFFWLVDINQMASKTKIEVTAQSVESARREALKSARTGEDSLNIDAAFSRAKNIIAPTAQTVKRKSGGLRLGFTLEKGPYTSLEEYDSIQNTLQSSLRDGWVKRRLIKKRIEIGNKFDADQKGFMSALFGLFMHHIAQLLFVSLPLFALILNLLHIRKKTYYYADHAIFAIHLYIFSFIMLMVYFAIQWLEAKTGWTWPVVLTTITMLSALLYYFLAMKKFYQQTVFKTIVKFLMLSFLSLIMMLVLFTGFGLFSLFEV